MTNFELLTYIAKATGKNLDGWGYSENLGFWKYKSLPGGDIISWNPRKNNADAFEVFVKLRLKIDCGKYVGYGCTAESHEQGIPGCTAFRDDKEEQVRIAICMVAAETGKQMKDYDFKERTND